MVVVIVVVAALVLVLAGAFVAVRVSGRSREHRRVAGEPAAPPVARSGPRTGTAPDEPALQTPSVEELEALLRAPAAPDVEAPPAPTAPPAPPAPPEVAPAPPPEPGIVERPRLRDRLGRTRNAFSGAFGRIRGRQIDDETWDELEESLLAADVGMTTTTRLLDAVRTRAKETSATEPDELISLLRDEVVTLLVGDTANGVDGDDRRLHMLAGESNVWMFVGVNGVGKTTTIGKLASQRVGDGHRVVLAAGDTFRAAAADQLQLWAERTGGELVRGQEGADPGSVVFDAMAAASGRGADLVLVDTAGRLHTKSNLMEELKKLRRIVDRTPGALKEVLLVIDASTGQNGLVQAKQFADAVDVTGIALTKLDGTAKGGIVLAIQSELGIPVKVVGVGEGVGDLIEFDPREFAAALFSDEG
ncbi:MAG: fused signal recognition particle receptor [Actinomycetota bacterium]|nr:fused signal recognition particle receptor [Actinomycetota bacterium]